MGKICAGRSGRIGCLKMSKQELLSPKELWEKLFNIDPKHFNGGYPDIALLRGYFQRYSDREESKLAKSSFQDAISDWDDEQIKEFIHLLTESEVSSHVPSEELHKILARAYEEIFEL